MGTNYILCRFGSLVTLAQCHRDGCQNFSLSHSLTMCGLRKLGGFPGKLKSVGRTAVAAAETEQKTIIPPVTRGDLIIMVKFIEIHNSTVHQLTPIYSALFLNTFFCQLIVFLF